MPISDFNGLMQYIMRDNTMSTDDDPVGFVIQAIESSTDGIDVGYASHTMTDDSQQGSFDSIIGKDVPIGTVSLKFLTIEPLGLILPDGYDTTTKSWGHVLGGCASHDFDLCAYHPCTNKATRLFRHIRFGEFDDSDTFEDAKVFALDFELSPNKGSVYGLTGDAAERVYTELRYNGTYDWQTGLSTFDDQNAGQ